MITLIYIILYNLFFQSCGQIDYNKDLILKQECNCHFDVQRELLTYNVYS